MNDERNNMDTTTTTITVSTTPEVIEDAKRAINEHTEFCPEWLLGDALGIPFTAEYEREANNRTWALAVKLASILATAEIVTRDAGAEVAA